MFVLPTALARPPVAAPDLVSPEDLPGLFATTLYTGTSTVRALDTGVDLASAGGLVWNKGRSAASSHFLFDTLRGANAYLIANTTGRQYTATDFLNGFTTSGVTLGSSAYNVNKSGLSYVLWSFRRAPGFFDVVKWDGNGVNSFLIPHALAVKPCFILAKSTGDAAWYAWHKSVNGGVGSVAFNTTSAWYTTAAYIHSGHTAAGFQIGSQSYYLNQSGVTYVAYLFADVPNIVATGTYTGTGVAAPFTVTCGTGWTPQWLLIRRVSGGSSHLTLLFDAARQGSRLYATSEMQTNSTAAEGSLAANFQDPVLAAPGFTLATTWEGLNASGASYAYLAIRKAG